MAENTGAAICVSDSDFPKKLGILLTAGVREIDLSCNHIIKGIEGGLCNVKSRFAAEALEELGKKLTEETLTSWQLAKRLEKAGFCVELERHYPGSREECDLVIESDAGDRFWIEVKYAWKKWHSCGGKVKGSSVYKGYLFGDPWHPGAAHDFGKLSKLLPDHARGVGMLLIGLDSDGEEMDRDIETLAQQEQLAALGWQLAAHDRWPDRRNPKCRINCWFWTRNSNQSGAEK